MIFYKIGKSMNIGEKIKFLRTKKNLTQQKLGDILGTSGGYIGLVENNRSTISKENIEKLEKFFGEPIMEKMKYIKFPLIKNIRASAGTGCYVYNEHETEIYEIPETMIKNINVNINESDFIIVSGDSMFPYLNNGDKILVDKSKTTIIDGKLYVIRESDRIIVKRVQKLPEGIRVISDNKEFKPYTLKEDFRICGQVLLIIRETL